MKISGICIYAMVDSVDHSSTTFSNGKATAEEITIKISPRGTGVEVNGIISIGRSTAKKLVRELQNQLKIRINQLNKQQ